MSFSSRWTVHASPPSNSSATRSNSIALVIDEKLQLGIIYVPETKTLYFASVSEESAYKATVENHDTSIAVITKIAKKITPSVYNDTIVVVGSRSHMNEKTQHYFDTLKQKYHHKTNVFA